MRRSPIAWKGHYRLDDGNNREKRLTKTYKESAKYGHAIYDIVYMVIAESKHIPFITADNKFCDKVNREKPFVMHLSNCKKSIKH